MTREVARRLLRDCLGLKPRDRVLLVADRKYLGLANRLGRVADSMGGRAAVELLPGLQPDGEPPSGVSLKMATSDIVVIVTRRSLSHSQARRDACRAGARVVTLPNLSPVSWRRGGLTADLGRVGRTARYIHDWVRPKKRFHVRSANGTDVYFTTAGATWTREDGRVCRPGEFDNLPAGEVAVRPSQVQGTVVFDLFGLSRGRLKLTIKDSAVVRFEGEAPGLQAAFRRWDRRARRVAEFGLGCNPQARFIRNILESEKVLGTCHFALGSDVSFGGANRVPFHRDGIIRRPTVEADGVALISDGKLVAPASVLRG